MCAGVAKVEISMEVAKKPKRNCRMAQLYPGAYIERTLYPASDICTSMFTVVVVPILRK